MPPKKKPNEPSKKTEQKQKAKIIEDKTFGLKNKKGGKQQKFIQQVQKQVTLGNKSAKQIEKDKEQKLTKKDDKLKQLDELNQLFRPVVEQKVQKGVDPKSVLCAFFKSGQCSKGDKCKFSHDVNIARKTEKRSMYDDTNVNQDEDSMANWDEKKLEEVVDKKHGERNKSLPKTDIICKYFLDAVESSKYGWFWECPNGETCHYRHALPPGFVLKKDKKKEDKGEEISLEDLIERERAALGSNLTKVTLESFILWKERKRKEKIQKETSEKEKRHADYRAGKAFGISGREMFEFNPDLVGADDDEADDTTQYIQSEDNDDDDANNESIREISLEAIAQEAREADGTGTVLSAEDRRKRLEDEMAAIRIANEAAAAAEAACSGGGNEKEGLVSLENDDGENVEDGSDEEEGQRSDDDEYEANGFGAEGVTDEPIDENLFTGDDILDVEEELENLDVQS